jgi:hypothetical protein
MVLITTTTAIMIARGCWNPWANIIPNRFQNK